MGGGAREREGERERVKDRERRMTGDVVVTTAAEWDRSEMVKQSFFPVPPSSGFHPSVHPISSWDTNSGFLRLLHSSSPPSSSSPPASSPVSRMKAAPDGAPGAENRKEGRPEDRGPAREVGDGDGDGLGSPAEPRPSGQTFREAFRQEQPLAEIQARIMEERTKIDRSAARVCVCVCVRVSTCVCVSVVEVDVIQECKLVMKFCVCS